MNRCAVLGIDSGKVSGIALACPFNPGTLGERFFDVAPGRAGATVLWTETTRRTPDREAAIARAKADAAELELDLVVVGERWAGRFAKGRGGTFQVTGLGASWGVWQVLLEQAEIPKRRTLRIDTGTWRTRMLGQPIRRATAQWDLAVRGYVKSRWPKLEFDSDDAAEAAIIAVFGLHWPKVGEVLPKRLRVSARGAV